MTVDPEFRKKLDRAYEIFTLFQNIPKTGDRSLTKDIPLPELRMTSYFYHLDSRTTAYKLIQQRVAELEKIEDRKKTRWEWEMGSSLRLTLVVN
jgi:hypothetical protein